MDEIQKRCCNSDWAILYLRILIGGALLLHNVAKMQDYNYIITSYHTLWGIGGATWYVAFSFIEVLCAFCLIMGRWVRLSAVILILGTISGMIVYFGYNSPLLIELNAIYILIYLLFVITGGGFYSLDSTRIKRVMRRRRNS